MPCLVYKPQPAPGISPPSPSPDSARSLNTVMDQFNFDARLTTSPLISELVKRLVLYESNLTEMKRTLDEVNRKVDTLLAQSTANHAPEFNTVIAPNQNLSYNCWGLGGEFVLSRSLIQVVL